MVMEGLTIHLGRIVWGVDRSFERQNRFYSVALAISGSDNIRPVSPLCEQGSCVYRRDNMRYNQWGIDTMFDGMQICHSIIAKRQTPLKIY